MANTVLITGASRGLGRSLAAAYLEGGDRVVAGVRDPEHPSLGSLSEQYAGSLIVQALDVASDASVAAAAEALAGEVDALDVCINNAAISTTERFGTLETCDFNEAADLYNVNALGPLRVARAFLPLLLKGTRAVVANISSEAGQITDNPRGGEFEYCMSKAALNQATALLGRRLAENHIRVLALHPGWIRTDMGGQDATGDPDDAARALVCVLDNHRADIGDHQFFDWEGHPLAW